MTTNCIRIKKDIYQLFDSGLLNYMVVHRTFKYKLSETVLLVEYDTIEEALTGRSMEIEFCNEIYLDNYRYLSRGWRILAFNIKSKFTDSASLNKVILSFLYSIDCISL